MKVFLTTYNVMSLADEEGLSLNWTPAPFEFMTGKTYDHRSHWSLWRD